MFLGDFGDFPVDKAFSIKFNKDIATKSYTTKMFIANKKVDTKVDGKSVRVSKSKGLFEPNNNTAYLKFNIK